MILHGAAGLRAAVGSHLGFSDWLAIDQHRIDLFAEATGAPPELLALALSNNFLPKIVQVEGFAMGVNYGTNTVRFPAPMPVDSRVRGGAELVEVTEVKGGLQSMMIVTIEIEGCPEPACVIESISRWLS